MDAVFTTDMSEREAIIDACHRWAQGMDDRDHELLRSALADHIYMDMSQYRAAGVPIPDADETADSMARMLIKNMENMNVMHCLSNFRAALLSDSTASIVCNVVAYHTIRDGNKVNVDQRVFTMAHKYTATLVKNATTGAWVIQRLVITPRCIQGDPRIIGLP